MANNNILISEADQELAEKQLFEGTKCLHKSVKRWINYGKM